MQIQPNNLQLKYKRAESQHTRTDGECTGPVQDSGDIREDRHMSQTQAKGVFEYTGDEPKPRAKKIRVLK